jgi:hypothetical protein
MPKRFRRALDQVRRVFNNQRLTYDERMSVLVSYFIAVLETQDPAMQTWYLDWFQKVVETARQDGLLSPTVQ